MELSRSAKGRVFEKHILDYGTLLYPGVAGGKVEIDDSFADTMIANFDKKICDIVQVPKADHANNHSEDPDRNIGEVIGLSKRNGKMYARIDARDAVAAEKLGKTLLGASAMFHLNYKDTKTGQKVGPTLVHVAITNRPYVTQLEDFEEIAALSNADGNERTAVLTPVKTDTKESTVDYATLKATLLADHNIDIDALQSKVAAADASVALSNKIIEKLGEREFVALSNGTADEAAVMTAIDAAADKIVSLSAKVAEVEEASAKSAATSRVDGLVRSGHILPKNKDAQVLLLLSNSDLFEALLPEKPLVKLSNNEGEAGFTASESTDNDTAEAEILRLTATPAAKAYIAPKAS